MIMPFESEAEKITASYAFFGWLVASRGLPSWRPPGVPAQDSASWQLALFLLALCVATTVHELGHLAAARLVGFRCLLVSVLWFALRRGPRGWRLGLGRGLGQCLAYSTDACDLRRRNIAYFGGGVAAGFAFTGLSALVLWLGAVPPGKLQGLLAWAFWIGLVLNSLSLVPDGVGSDGFCLYVMFRGEAACDQLIATFTCQLREEAGERYRDLDPKLVAALTRPACTKIWELGGQNTAYLVAEEAGRLEEARAGLQRLRKLSGSRTSRPIVDLELAYFAAVHEKNAGEARRHFEAAGGRGPQLVRRIAEAAILIEEGRLAAARSSLDQARSEVRALANTGTGRAQHVVEVFDSLSVRADG